MLSTMRVQQVLEIAAAENIDQAVVNAWFKEEGEAVVAGDLLVELEAEKTSTEVFASVTGTLVKVVAVVGDEIAPGDVLAEFEVTE